jgi:hypothetical protein
VQPTAAFRRQFLFEVGAGISICYIDEAGCSGKLPSSTSPIQPLLVISALIIDLENIALITKEFLVPKTVSLPVRRKRHLCKLQWVRVLIKDFSRKSRLCQEV